MNDGKEENDAFLSDLKSAASMWHTRWEVSTVVFISHGINEQVGRPFLLVEIEGKMMLKWQKKGFLPILQYSSSTWFLR